MTTKQSYKQQQPYFMSWVVVLFLLPISKALLAVYLLLCLKNKMQYNSESIILTIDCSAYSVMSKQSVWGRIKVQWCQVGYSISLCTEAYWPQHRLWQELKHEIRLYMNLILQYLLGKHNQNIRSASEKALFSCEGEAFTILVIYRKLHCMQAVCI